MNFLTHTPIGWAILVRRWWGNFAFKGTIPIFLKVGDLQKVNIFQWSGWVSSGLYKSFLNTVLGNTINKHHFHGNNTSVVKALLLVISILDLCDSKAIHKHAALHPRGDRRAEAQAPTQACSLTSSTEVPGDSREWQALAKTTGSLLGARYDTRLHNLSSRYTYPKEPKTSYSGVLGYRLCIFIF
jgi:hypothetical protein